MNTQAYTASNPYMLQPTDIYIYVYLCVFFFFYSLRYVCAYLFFCFCFFFFNVKSKYCFEGRRGAGEFSALPSWAQSRAYTLSDGFFFFLDSLFVWGTFCLPVYVCVFHSLAAAKTVVVYVVCLLFFFPTFLIVRVLFVCLFVCFIYKRQPFFFFIAVTIRVLSPIIFFFCSPLFFFCCSGVFSHSSLYFPGSVALKGRKGKQQKKKRKA